MTVDSTLLVIAPEMASVDSAQRTAMAEIAATRVGAVFGDKTELATAYLTAHMLTVAQRAGNAGAVKSMKEGDLSTTFATADTNDSYMATSYGAEFIQIRKSVVFAARTRGV